MNIPLVMVWVFTASGNRGFPSAVFSQLDSAEIWIRENNLSGVLTEYPVDISTYDWAIAKGAFKPKRDEQRSPKFIGNFTSIAQRHYHYEDGFRPSS